MKERLFFTIENASDKRFSLKKEYRVVIIKRIYVIRILGILDSKVYVKLTVDFL